MFAPISTNEVYLRSAQPVHKTIMKAGWAMSRRPEVNGSIFDNKYLFPFWYFII